MDKICVIAKNKETYFIKRLIEEVGEGVKLFDPWSDFELPLASTYVTRTTGVYGNDLDLFIIKSLDQTKVKNTHEVLSLFRSKKTQYEWFDEKNFPILPWISIRGLDLVTIEKFFRLYPEAVVKPLIGQGGWGVEVLTWDTFRTWKKKKGNDESYLLQPLIKNATELRYFFIQGEEPVVLERSAKSGVAANFKNRGSAKVSKLPDELTDTLDQVVQDSTAFYGAIDLLLYDGKLYILELNVVPGIEQLEEVSGLNIMKKILQNFP